LRTSWLKVGIRSLLSVKIFMEKSGRKKQPNHYNTFWVGCQGKVFLGCGQSRI